MNSIPRSRYLGRFIILGKDGDAFVAIYGVLGRNASSLNRKYIQQGNSVIAVQLEEGGNQELLEYTALRFSHTALVVANGRQMDIVKEFATGDTAKDRLLVDLADVSCEPDKYKTPRITGAYVETSSGPTAALHIVRSLETGEESRDCWDIPLVSGEGSYISTYSGEDVRPTPPFAGDPLKVPLSFGSAEAAATAVYDLFAPSTGEPDYRVSVIACYKKTGEMPEVAIFNKVDMQ